jgi:hypothetical protein
MSKKRLTWVLALILGGLIALGCAAPSDDDDDDDDDEGLRRVKTEQVITR